MPIGWDDALLAGLGGLGNYLGQQQANESNKYMVRDTNRTNMQIAYDTNQANIGMQNQTNALNMRLAQMQFLTNKAMLEEQNIYNSPKAQMTRLQEAGLNPNLVYGGGSATTQSGQPPRLEYPRMEAGHAERANMESPRVQNEIGFMNLATYQQIKNMNAEQANIIEQGKLLRKEQELKDAEIRNRNIEADTKERDLRINQRTDYFYPMQSNENWLVRLGVKQMYNVHDLISQGLGKLNDLQGWLYKKVIKPNLEEVEKRNKRGDLF